MAFTTQPKPVTFYAALGLNAEPIIHGEEAAGQSWKRGAFLQDDDSGLIVPSASPIDASAVTKRAFGLAHNDATGVTGADVVMTWLTPQTIIEITLSDNTAGAHTLAATDKWKVYGAAKGTNYWALDANAVSDTGGFVVVGFKDPVGTVDGRVFAVITNTARGGANAGSATF